jgi:hypothetical protein
MTKKQDHEFDGERALKLEADLRYHAAVASALGDRASSFASRLVSEGLDSSTIRAVREEVHSLQEALPRALMELNKAAVAEYEARG